MQNQVGPPGCLKCYHVQVLCDHVKSLWWQCNCEDEVVYSGEKEGFISLLNVLNA